ncbi:MAG: hypothetical protein CMK92_03805 [Pseudomonas sp.]|nr:hypothetical protein [Pseudomonas sp.]
MEEDVTRASYEGQRSIYVDICPEDVKYMKFIIHAIKKRIIDADVTEETLVTGKVCIEIRWMDSDEETSDDSSLSSSESESESEKPPAKRQRRS